MSVLSWTKSEYGDILDHFRPHPEASQTVKSFAEDWLLQDQHDYVVVDHDQLAGIVSGACFAISPTANGATRN